MNHNYKNVFDSPAAYYDPRNLSPVPLFKLPPELVPFPRGDRVHYYAQAAYLWPLGSLKHPAVWHMLQMAQERGELDGVHTIADSSSGSTAYCEALLAHYRGIKTVLYVPSDIPKTKENRLRDLVDMKVNIELTKCSEDQGEPSAMQQACLKGKEGGCFYLGQYQNPDNVEGHELYHIKPAWEQTNGEMTIYAGGLGTCGHIGAALKFFKRTAPVAVVAGYCAEKNPLPGIRTLKRLETVPLAKICLDPENQDIHRIEVLQNKAYQSSWKLSIAGIKGGPTSGAAKVALDTYLLAQRQNPDAWEALRNRDGNIVAVFMCGDGKDLYSIEKYLQSLDSNEIP